MISKQSEPPYTKDWAQWLVFENADGTYELMSRRYDGMLDCHQSYFAHATNGPRG